MLHHALPLEEGEQPRHFFCSFCLTYRRYAYSSSLPAADLARVPPSVDTANVRRLLVRISERVFARAGVDIYVDAGFTNAEALRKYWIALFLRRAVGFCELSFIRRVSSLN